MLCEALGRDALVDGIPFSPGEETAAVGEEEEILKSDENGGAWKDEAGR